MSSHHNATYPNPNREADDAQYYRRILHRLIDIGVDLACQIRAQATTPLKPGATRRAPSEDQVAAFDRVARTVRQTIVFARHIAQSSPSQANGPANPSQGQTNPEPDERKLNSRPLRPRHPLH